MERSILKRLLIVFVFCLLALPSGTVKAANGLNMQQNHASLPADGRQSYSLSYNGSEMTAGTGALTMEFGDGFQADNICVGDWNAYEGNIKVLITYHDANGSVSNYSSSYAENSIVSVPSVVQGTVDSIQLTPDNDSLTSAVFQGVKVDGSINENEIGDTLTTTASYTWNAADGTSSVIGSANASMDCGVYRVAKPVLTASSSSVDYLGDLNLTVNGISGSGNYLPKSYRVTVNLSDRLFVDAISLPVFDHATYKLYVDGREQDIKDSRIYINTRVNKIELSIIPDIGDFSQTQDMVIETRNSTNADANESYSASVKAEYGNGAVAEAVSDLCSVHFVAAEIIDPEPEEPSEPVEPVDPSEPEDPVEPVEPVEPSVPGTDNDSKVPDASEEKPEDTKRPSIKDKLNLVGMKIGNEDNHKPEDLGVVLSDSANTENLQSALRDRLQTTSIFDFSARSDASEHQSDKDSTVKGVLEPKEKEPAESIEKTPSEKAKEKIKEATDNSYLWILLIIVLIAGAGAIIITVLFHHKGKEEDVETEDLEELEYGSQDQSLKRQDPYVSHDDPPEDPGGSRASP